MMKREEDNIREKTRKKGIVRSQEVLGDLSLYFLRNRYGQSGDEHEYDIGMIDDNDDDEKVLEDQFPLTNLDHQYTAQLPQTKWQLAKMHINASTGVRKY